jgi:hypothetical protein
MGKAQRPLFLSRRSASAARATLRQTTRPSRSPIAKHLFALSRASNGALFPNLYLSALAWISIACSSETLNDELPVVKLSHRPARLHYPRKPAAASHLQTAREDSVRNHSGKMNLRHPDAKVRRPAERRRPVPKLYQSRISTERSFPGYNSINSCSESFSLRGRRHIGG